MSTETWFEIDRWSLKPAIKEITVVSRSACFITVKRDWFGKVSERRQRIDSDVHQTWESAREELWRRATRDVQRHTDALQRARSFLGEVEGMKP